MPRLPMFQCVSVNNDSVTLLWYGNAQKYKIEYKRKSQVRCCMGTLCSAASI